MPRFYEPHDKIWMFDKMTLNTFIGDTSHFATATKRFNFDMPALGWVLWAKRFVLTDETPLLSGCIRRCFNHVLGARLWVSNVSGAKNCNAQKVGKCTAILAQKQRRFAKVEFAG